MANEKSKNEVMSELRRHGNVARASRATAVSERTIFRWLGDSDSTTLRRAAEAGRTSAGTPGEQATIQGIHYKRGLRGLTFRWNGYEWVRCAVELIRNADGRYTIAEPKRVAHANRRK
jgi:hypothetical protein